MSFTKACGMFEQGLYDNDDVFESINNKKILDVPRLVVNISTTRQKWIHCLLCFKNKKFQEKDDQTISMESDVLTSPSNK